MNYYIQGDAANADKIKAAFEKLNTHSINGYDFSRGDVLFFSFTGKEGVKYMMSTNIDSWLADMITTHPDYKELELPVEPKFKVGDEIKTGNTIETIAEIGYNIRSYYCESGRTISFANQDLWHLVPKPHYYISNFKPFDKVLVRDADYTKWRCNWFSHYSGDGGVYRFFTTKCGYAQCIPYEGNEHLLGTTDMCGERFLNW